jgi:MFS family permease
MLETLPKSRYAFALLAYAFAVIMIGATLPTPMYALYAERLHFEVLTTTIIFATYAAGVLAALITFGSWSDAVGRRPVLFVGILFALASSVVFLVADSVPLLLVGRLLSGLSAGVFTGTATAAVIEAAPPHWQTRASAVATIANVAGLGGGPLLAGLLVQYAPQPLHLAFVVHTGLMIIAAVAVLFAPETSPRTGHIGIQRLSVPAEVRSVFVVAAIAAFACFAITGLFTSVAPAFVSDVVGIKNHAVAGAVASTILIASAVAQVFAGRIPPRRALVVGCAILIVGMVILAAALELSTLFGLIVAATVAGIGQGIAFSRGLAAVAERTPADRRAEVSSMYFVVAYVAISLPVIGEGLAAQHWGLRTAGVSFAIAVGLLAVACLIAIVVQETRKHTADTI